MKLYQWSSKGLANYYDGDIIVMASSVEEAREKVMAQAKGEFSCNETRLKEIEVDIQGNPSIIENGVVFVVGGS